jgi:hypothetical protein
VNHFVESLGEFGLLNILEVLLEHFVEVEHEGLRRTIIDVDNLLKGHFDRHIDLRILFHSPALYTADSLSQVDHFDHQIVILDLFTYEFISFSDDELGQMLSEKLE